MEDLKRKTCCFTGHRNIDKERLCELEELLEASIEKFIMAGITVYRAGGALGFDTSAAQKVLKLRKTYPEISLELILPCKDQTRGWSAKDKQIYEEILSEANSVVFLHDKYRRGCMHERNRALVDGSGVCLAYCTSRTGGTAYTVDYAKSNDVCVINLARLLKKT
ncbi:MAG: DUF1273 family protein [Clostridia bacterium]|nr:DUF1273 family protein [Clostridia bacterium]